MKTGTLLLAAATVVVLLCSVVDAQWISYPASGAPRLADGKVDLNASTPRTSDAKPDLSGIWRPLRPLPYRETRGFLSDYEYFLASNSRIQMRPWADTLYKNRAENFGAGKPSERCLPNSWQNQILIGQPIQVIQTPAFTTILFEELNHFRQIFTDGRNHPTERNPSWYGYSVGRWENDEFVIDSVGFRDGTWLDGSGHPGTESLRALERYRRRDFGHLELHLTIDDPAAYVTPWVARVEFELMGDANLIEHICENERSAQHIVGK